MHPYSVRGYGNVLESLFLNDFCMAKFSVLSRVLKTVTAYTVWVHIHTEITIFSPILNTDDFAIQKSYGNKDFRIFPIPTHTVGVHTNIAQELFSVIYSIHPTLSHKKCTKTKSCTDIITHDSRKPQLHKRTS